MITNEPSIAAASPSLPEVSETSKEHEARLSMLLKTPNTAAMAAIPEAGDSSSVMYRSKRRAGSTDEDMQARASRLKASRNLDVEFTGGNDANPT
jgi:hypothetical protein